MKIKELKENKCMQAALAVLFSVLLCLLAFLLDNRGILGLPGETADMMEETVSILAHGACGISKRVFGAENRVERLPNPKDVATYEAKLPQLLADKHRLFCTAGD